MFFGTPHQETKSRLWDDLVFDIALASLEAQRSTRRHIMTSIIKTGVGGIKETSERFNQLAGQYKTINFYATRPNHTTGSIVCIKILHHDIC